MYPLARECQGVHRAAQHSILHRCQTELDLDRLRAKGKLSLGKCAGLPWVAGVISHAHACATCSHHLYRLLCPWAVNHGAVFLAAGTAGAPALGPHGKESQGAIPSALTPVSYCCHCPCRGTGYMCTIHCSFSFPQDSMAKQICKRAHAIFLWFLLFDSCQ